MAKNGFGLLSQIEKYLKNFFYFRQQEKLLLKWVRGLFFSVYQWTFSTNFFLYCLTGRKFRIAARNYFRNCVCAPCWNCKFLSSSFSRIRNQLTHLTRSQSTQSTGIEMGSQNNNQTINQPETKTP